MVEEKEAVQQSPEDDEKNVSDVRRNSRKHDSHRANDTTNSPEPNWDDAFLVTFSQDDSENPLNWSQKLKWGITAAVSGTGFVRIMVSTMMAPAINTTATELNMTTTESTMALSVYLLATAFGPLLIGPLSEVYGRRSIFHFTNIWFLVFNLTCGFAHSKGLLIAARLLAGFGASAVYSLAYGVLGDVWPAEQRRRSLSLYLLIPLTGSAVGPIVSGFIVEYSTWRWMFWATSILQVILELSSLLLFHESYAPVLLRRRAEKQRKETGDSRWHAEVEKRESGRSAGWTLRRSLSRPLRLLAVHPVTQIQAILEGINYGLLYFALASFSALYVSAYDESISISGLHYIAICTGTISGAQICGPLMDYIYKRLKIRNTTHSSDIAIDSPSPELRIPLLLPGVFITPLGFLLYGWAAQYRLFWLVVDIGAAMLSLGMQIFDITLHAYVMDAYPEHISSASAATQVLRSLLAFAFPLFSSKMYETLVYRWGNSLLAFLSIGVALPATGIHWRYGAKLRGGRQSSY
ncbi:putative efflux pump mfs2 [Lachnellula suecica]|uniref:Putative efflux pump mfs2 n=1 Tax=Lachnellula suecica TaxID=602035 RepID=A0A8T9CPJ9_9HELO|nr:putative efflux pump mfs2 [Lachnellula suecica]